MTAAAPPPEFRPPALGPVLSARNVAIVWLFVALLFSAQNITSALIRGRPISLQWDVTHELIYWGLWAACTPIIARQARRYWLERGGGARPWLAHVLTALVLAPLQVAATYTVHGAIHIPLGIIPIADVPAFLQTARRSIPFLSFTGFFYYWIVLGVYYALAYRQLYLVQRAETAEASLNSLRAQLQPHFLFNTLNSVAVLAEENPGAAALVLTRLSDLLRTVLRHDPRHQVPLDEELEFIRSYLEIQRVRFEDRLRVRLEADPATRRALVPWLVLQPLVENAVRYAVEPRVAGGTVVVLARRVGDELVLLVEDDGPGLGQAAAGGKSAGIGITNTAARLERLYGDRHELRIESGDHGGLSVRIVLPFVESSAS